MNPLDLGPALLRVAAWPIEAVDELRSPELSSRVDGWIEREARVLAEGDRLADRIRDVVPRLDASRAEALELRRRLHRSAGPLPERLIARVAADPALPPDLAEALAAEARERAVLAADRAALAADHQVALGRESTALDRLVGTPRFLRALCLASPAVYAAWARQGSLEPKRVRKLEHTLFEYAMRAVGRAAPNGLWAGVALEGSGAPGGRWTAVFSPALSPLLAIARVIAAGRPDVPLRVNPTLERLVDGSWRFGRREAGAWSWQGAPGHPLLAAMAAFPDPDRPRPREEIALELSRAFPGSTPEALSAAVEDLRAIGALWPSLELPGRYEDAWQAAEALAAAVPEPIRDPWTECLRELRSVAGRLADRLDEIPAAEFALLLDEARGAVARLAGRFGVDPPPSGESVLAADLAAPFAFSLQPGMRREVEEALRSAWAFDRHGVGELLAEAERRREFGEVARGGEAPLVALAVVRQLERRRPFVEPASGWEGILPEIDDPDLRARTAEAFDRWRRELEPVHARSVHRLPAGAGPRGPFPPGSALLVLFREDGRERLRVGSLTSDPALFYSRFHSVLGGGGRFVRWYREGLARVERDRPGLRVSDLAVRVEANPNPAARPELAPRLVDPLGRDRLAVGRWRIRFASGRIALVDPAGPSVPIPTLHSAVPLELEDGITRALHLSTYLRGRTCLLRPLPLFRDEIERWRHLPRLLLAEGPVLAPERWVVPVERTGELARAAGFERFLAWRRLVRDLRLPERIYGKFGEHRTESLIAADGVLAVEHLGRTLAARGGILLLQEMCPAPESFTVRDEAGRRYQSVVAVAWHGEDEWWAGLADLGGLP